MLDTPTRAQTCGRPQTRRWRELMRAARSDEAEAQRLRTELNRYLSSADSQAAQRAARRAARSAATERRQPTAAARGGTPAVEDALPAAHGVGASIERTGASVNAEKHTAPAGAKKRRTALAQPQPQAEQGDDPEIADWSGANPSAMQDVLATLSSAWTERVAALREVAASGAPVDAALAAGLCVQLADLRSRVVVEACDAVKARTGALAARDALHIAAGALGCVAVKKAVMADAREAAAVAALAPLYDHDDAWAAVAAHLAAQPAERARAATVRAVTGWVPVLPPHRDPALAALLAPALTDRAPAVRDAAKALFAAFKRLHPARAPALREALPPHARARLPSDKPGPATGKPSIRDQIRARRAALAAEKKQDLPNLELVGFSKGLGESSRNQVLVPPEPAKKKFKHDQPQALADKENRV